MLFILLPARPRRKAKPEKAMVYTNETAWGFQFESNIQHMSLFVHVVVIKTDCGDVSEGFSIETGCPHAERLQWYVPLVLCGLSAEMISRSID